MITQIKLKDWKSFGEATLHIDPLTILIGTNASGKSNILDALNLLQRTGQGLPWHSAVSGQSREDLGIRGGAEWMTRRGALSFCLQVRLTDDTDKNTVYDYALELMVSEDGRIETVEENLTRLRRRLQNGSYQYSKRLFYTERKEDEGPSIITYVNNNKQGRGRRFDLRRNTSILSQVGALATIQEVVNGAEAVSHQLGRIYVYDPIPSLMRGYSRLSERLSNNGENIAGVLAALDDVRKLQVEDKLLSYLRKLPENDIERVYAEPVGRLQTDAMLYCEEQQAGHGENILINARGMSDGTLRFLGILTALLTLPIYSLLVIEEIDNGLHPSRSHLLVDLLRSVGKERQIDVVCTTHNPALLNELGNRMVPFISIVYRNDHDGLSSIRLLEDIKNLSRLMARGKVGTLLSKGLLEEAVQ